MRRATLISGGAPAERIGREDKTLEEQPARGGTGRRERTRGLECAARSLEAARRILYLVRARIGIRSAERRRLDVKSAYPTHHVYMYHQWHFYALVFKLVRLHDCSRRTLRGPKEWETCYSLAPAAVRSATRVGDEADRHGITQ